jgi:hypothetical protein
MEAPPTFYFFSFTCERYFHLEIMASSLSYGFSFMGDGFSSSSSNDDDILE